jgi:N-acetylglucosamine-6-phosphate deacetylase
MAIRILSKYIFRKGRFEEGELWFEKGKIIDPKAKATSILDFTEFYIIPAFIDLQVNGGF